MDRLTKSRILIQLRELLHYYYNNSSKKVDTRVLNYLNCLTLSNLTVKDLELINRFAKSLDYNIYEYGFENIIQERINNEIETRN